MTNEMKTQIDAMTYEQMLRLNRYAPTGSPYFTGSTGRYFLNRMKKMRAEPGGSARHTAASKRIGWD